MWENLYPFKNLIASSAVQLKSPLGIIYKKTAPTKLALEVLVKFDSY